MRTARLTPAALARRRPVGPPPVAPASRAPGPGTCRTGRHKPVGRSFSSGGCCCPTVSCLLYMARTLPPYQNRCFFASRRRRRFSRSQPARQHTPTSACLGTAAVTRRWSPLPLGAPLPPPPFPGPTRPCDIPPATLPPAAGAAGDSWTLVPAPLKLPWNPLMTDDEVNCLPPPPAPPPLPMPPPPPAPTPPPRLAAAAGCCRRRRCCATIAAAAVLLPP